MHHKFAIFESNVVISGSYNWTNSAEFNEENITVITDLIEIERFKNEYKKLLILTRIEK